MADMANAAILASLIVGMVSIPAASGNIGAQEPVEKPLDNISSTDSVPVQESTELSSDSFQKKVETAYSSFVTEITSGDVEGSLETPQSELTLERDPGTTTWTLETSKGTLTVKQTSKSVIQETETPQGTLREVKENGNLRTSFEGSDRESVRETSRQLRELMKQKRKEYMDRSGSMRTEQYEKGVKLDVAPETPEKVILTNKMGSELDLEGWRVANNNPDSADLEAKLEPGQELHLYSADKDSEELEDVTENEEDIYVYGSGLTWEDGGDTATLFDSQGKEVESFSY